MTWVPVVLGALMVPIGIFHSLSGAVIKICLKFSKFILAIFLCKPSLIETYAYIYIINKKPPPPFNTSLLAQERELKP